MPDADRSEVLEFGELAAPSLDFGLTWPQYQSVQRGLAGFNAWLGDASADAARAIPATDLMSQLIEASEDGVRLDETELQAIAGLVLAAGFETTVNLLGNGIRMLLNAPDQLAVLRRRSVAVAERRRGDPAAGLAGATDRAGGPHRHRGGRHARSGPARLVRDLSGRRQPRSGGVRRSAPLRRASGPTPASTWRSPAAGTSAWARRWREPRARSDCAGSSPTSPTRNWPARAAAATPACCAAGPNCRSAWAPPLTVAG